MKFLSTFLVHPLLALAAIDPHTVTSLTPQQSSAFYSAQVPLIASLTGNPSFTSIAVGLTTNAAFSSLNKELAGAGAAPTGTAAFDRLSSLLNALPTPAKDLFQGFLNSEIAALSSVVNDRSLGGGSTGNAAAPAPTGGVVKARVAVGALGAAIALL